MNADLREEIQYRLLAAAEGAVYTLLWAVAIGLGVLVLSATAQWIHEGVWPATLVLQPRDLAVFGRGALVLSLFSAIMCSALAIRPLRGWFS